MSRLLCAIRRSPPGRAWRRGRDVELGPRSLGFAALGFLALVPLLIVVSATDPARGAGIAQWLGDGLGVSTVAREHVRQVFTRPGQVLRTTTAFGLSALAVFGLSFAAVVQAGYEKLWELTPARWYARWRHVLWLTVLIAFLSLSATTTVWRHSEVGTLAAVLGAVLFFWWSQHILLGGRIPWRDLLPGAVLTAIGLLCLRLFSHLVFSPLIASSAVTYGPFGTVLVIQSWLVGVGVVVFGGALVGRMLAEALPSVVHAVKQRTRRRT